MPASAFELPPTGLSVDVRPGACDLWPCGLGLDGFPVLVADFTRFRGPLRLRDDLELLESWYGTRCAPSP